MSKAQEARGGSVAQMFLRYAVPLSGLRRWPIVGPLVGWASGTCDEHHFPALPQ